MSNTTGVTCGAGPFGAPDITPSFLWGLCCLVFIFQSGVLHTIVWLFVFFLFSHAVVSLFSIYEFECPSGIFRPSLNLFGYLLFSLFYILAFIS